MPTCFNFDAYNFKLILTQGANTDFGHPSKYAEQTDNIFPSKIPNMPSKLQILSEQTENSFPSKIANMPSKLQILSEQSQIIGDKPILTVIADKIFGGLELSPIGEADVW